MSSKHDMEGSMDGLDCSYRRTTLDFDPNAVLSPEQLLAFNFLPHPIWIFDFVERRHRWANKAGLRLWEAKDLDDLLRRDLSGMSGEAEARTRSAHLRVEQGLCIEDEWTIYPNGRAKSVFLSATGLRLSADEDHCCILCSAVPTMARETVVNETLRGNEMLQQLPMAICQFDMDGKVVYRNPASEIVRTEEKVDEESHCSSISGDNSLHPQTIVSCDEDENSNHDDENCEENSIISSSCSSFSENDFVERFVDPKVAQTILETIQTEDEVNLQAELHTSHGPQWSAIQLRKMNDPVTRKATILFCSQDKTDAMEAKREREASMQKSEFLAIMAHEIRTPLHQVIGFIDLLIQTKLDPEQTGFVKLLKSSAQGLMTVISDVLDYSKLEAGQMNFECIPYEPLGVLQGCMAAVRASCDEKDLFLTMDWSNRIPFRLLGDPNRLRQILLNLLSNAVKFTRHGGIHIKVLAIEQQADDATTASTSAHTRRRGSSICSGDYNQITKSCIKFIIKDTGIGIPKENQKKIFEKYQQGNLSVARNYGGTGLGLSICQLLTERMGGSIGVESQPGHGSSFWVALPMEVPHESPLSMDQSERSLADEVVPLNILIAEDNLINQKLMKSMLARFGHQSTVAQNGKEAIEMVQNGTYDLVFMDIQMPVMDGLEATRRLRSMGYSKLPIYGLTASVKHSDYSDLGFDDWLPKPIPMNELKTKLSKLSSSKREQSNINYPCDERNVSSQNHR